MTSAETWAVIVGGMVVTYTTRLSFILLPHPERLPEVFRRGMRLVAPAVLAVGVGLAAETASRARRSGEVGHDQR